MKPEAFKAKIVLAASFLCAAYCSQAIADDVDPPPRPWGSLARNALGNTLEKNRIGVLGWAEGTLLETNNNIGDTLQPAGYGQSVLPQGLFTQMEGATLNQAGVMICSGPACPPVMFGPQHNVLGRIGPTPAPKSESIDIGFNVTAMYGEDVFFLKTKGLDDWDWDVENQNKFALTQWFLDIYLPIFDGASLMVGSFQTPLSNDIGYPFTPPNWFVSHTYAFGHGPAKHVGALAQVKIPTAKEFGLLSVEGGIVTGWNVLESPNGDPSYIAGIRWRSPNMKTWIDVETIYGNGENDGSDTVTLADGSTRARGGGSPYLAVSATGDYLARFSGDLVITHQVTDKLQFALEAIYGYQEGGDALPGLPPFAITEDSPWYGANVAFRYMLQQNVFFNARAEWFRDENGAHLLWGNVGAKGGDVYALTANLNWDPNPWLTIRPEVRYDVYTGKGHLFAPAYPVGSGAPPQAQVATEDEQLTFMLNGVTRF